MDPEDDPDLTNPDLVNNAFALTVAGSQADEVHLRRLRHENPKIPDLFAADCQPPRMIKGVVLFQAAVRRKKFRRRFGDDVYTDPNSPYADFAPPSPQLALSLFMCRRLTKPKKWVNVPREAMGVASVLAAN